MFVNIVVVYLLIKKKNFYICKGICIVIGWGIFIVCDGIFIDMFFECLKDNVFFLGWIIFVFFMGILMM